MTAPRMKMSDVDACQHVGRDVHRNRTTIGLAELDELCDAARAGVVAHGPEVKSRIEAVLVELRTQAAISEDVPVVYRKLIAWAKQLERALAELEAPYRPEPVSDAAAAADEFIRARKNPRCIWAKAADIPGFTESPVTMGSLVAIELPPNVTVIDAPALVPNPQGESK